MSLVEHSLFYSQQLPYGSLTQSLTPGITFGLMANHLLKSSNYPSNSGPPPPPNPFGAGAYQGGMAGGAYNNYGYSAYNVNQYPQAGGYQQYGYGGSGAVAGFTAPAYSGPTAGYAPQSQPPPPSMQYQNMQNQMANMGMMQMQQRLISQMQLVSDDEDYEEEERRMRRRQRRRRRMQDDDEAYEQDLEEEKRLMEERAQKAEEKARKLQEKLENNEELKAQLRMKFIDELMRRQEVSGTFEETQGTVVPCITYEEDDPVTIWFATDREEGTMDIVGEPWDGQYDAEFLRNGMKGLGTNEQMIIDVVASRSCSQRYATKKEYKTLYGRDLIKDLKSELSGDFKSSILACYESPARYDAWCVKKAIYGAGTDELTLIEILMTRTNAQIREMTDEYNKITYANQRDPESSLEQDLIDDTSGDFKKLLVSAAQGNRRLIPRQKLEDSVEEVLHNGQWTGLFRINFEKLCNMSRCKQYAEELYKAGEDKLGTDEETFIRIFASQDYYTLRVVWDEYVKLTQRDILNSVERETSGDFKHGLCAIAQNIKCRPMYFAERLYKSMKGLGTDDTTLIRVVVSRSEIDMIQIKACFLEKYKQTLWNFIKDDTSGDYRKILLGIAGRN
ncbi:hypothetical protein LSH36_10g09004 [Paralvinella palmiformis]|uniref:Annexin n=1 Tax=Paralvinella palmiformis TaxID=53620 RepID=A0AAD9KE57_9ANNE|nr:hypothetical protein LSH36_10g09004 [Paralvinella palmiformis]